MTGRKITIIYVNGEKEEKDATFGLDVKIDENTSINLRLSGDVSDELKSKCIDKAFELVTIGTNKNGF